MDLTQVLALSKPLFQQFAVIVVIPLICALWKSECLALDNSTQANGFVQGYRLFKKYIALVPPDAVKAVEVKIEAALPDQAGQLMGEVITELGKSEPGAPA